MDPRDFLGHNGLPYSEAQKLLRRVVDVGLRFKYRKPFGAPPSREALDLIATEPLPLEGQPVDELLTALADNYLPHMPNFASTAFAGFPDAGNSVAGTAGALLAELLNVNMINAEFCSRGATEMEIALIRWLRELIGYTIAPTAPMSATDVGGIPTAGGTNANFAAVLLARTRASADVRQKGLGRWNQRQRVILPEHVGHYTVGASLAWSGLGTDAALYSPVKDFRYDLPRLHDTLSAAQERGDEVIMAVTYAGDSRTMTIDELGEVAATVRQYYPEAWLHCDGCHGTSLLFSSSQRSRLDGLSEYDSVMMDPHKVLTVPYSNSFLLLRDPADAAMISTESELILRQARSFGQVTPATGSRAFHSLRTWMLLKSLGVQGVGSMIDRRIDAARRFAEIIDESPYLIRLNDVSINSVMFTLDPVNNGAPFGAEAAEVSARATEKAYQAILHDGAAYLHSFLIADTGDRLGLGRSYRHPVLRFMSGNPLIQDVDMFDLVEQCVDLAKLHRTLSHTQ
ncbi:pyridoxal-dependent decarboxylase [Actinocrispum sp. NPDC049592]|uniref:pyridoxal phosphate-dependent decarboxylase family protein n=1 Tax=Actinocrispum sp. NPDC049592 TaxID=3154835 RepID=UPI00342FAB11